MSTEGMYLARVDDALKDAMAKGADKVSIADVRRLVDQFGDALLDDNVAKAEAKARLEVEISRTRWPPAWSVKKRPVLRHMPGI
jgi:hypothetical protein